MAWTRGVSSGCNSPSAPGWPGAPQGNAALADYYWGSLADYEDGHFPNEERRLAKVSLQQANALAKRLFDGEGYLRIEKPLFDDDMLYPLLLAAGLLASGLLWFGLRRRRA